MSISINSTNQHVVITGACDVFAKLWDIRTSKAVQTLAGHESDINWVLHKWDVEAGSKLATMIWYFLGGWGSTSQGNPSSLCLYGSQRVGLGRPRTTFVDGLSSLGLDIIMTRIKSTQALGIGRAFWASDNEDVQLRSLRLNIIMTLDQRHTSSWDWTNLLGQ